MCEVSPSRAKYISLAVTGRTAVGIGSKTSKIVKASKIVKHIQNSKNIQNSKDIQNSENATGLEQPSDACPKKLNYSDPKKIFVNTHVIDRISNNLPRNHSKHLKLYDNYSPLIITNNN